MSDSDDATPVTCQSAGASFNLMVLGEGAVGKTCIVRSFCDEPDATINHLHSATIEVDVRSRDTQVHETSVRLHFYDMAGSRRFRPLVLRQLGRAHALLLVFDMTQRESFCSLAEWLSDLKALEPRRPIHLVANKADLLERFKVSVEEAESYAKQQNLQLHLISAHNRCQVNGMIMKLMNDVLCPSTAALHATESRQRSSEVSTDSRK